MSDLVERAIVREKMLKYGFTAPDMTVHEFIEDELPSVTQKSGKWIKGKCSICGEHAPFWSMATTYYESKYCPNCGAEMESEE